MPAATLPLNLHFRHDGAELVDAFAAYIVPAPKSYAPEHTRAASQARQAIQAKVEAELIAAGADANVASLAAGSFCSFGFAPSYGLADMDDRLAAIRAKAALDAWVGAKVQAYLAPQTRKAA